MTSASNHVRLLRPLRQTTEVGAHGTERKEALVGMNDVNAGTDIECDGIERVPGGAADVDDRRRLIKDIRLEVLIAKCHCAGSRDAERTQPKLQEKLTTV